MRFGSNGNALKWLRDKVGRTKVASENGAIPQLQTSANETGVCVCVCKRNAKTEGQKCIFKTNRFLKLFFFKFCDL